MNILGLSSTHNLNWKLHISSLAKTASMKLGILRCLCQFFFVPPTANSVQGPCPSRYGVLFACMERGITLTQLFDRVKSKAFHFINSSSLTDCLQPLSLSLHRNAASLAIFMLTAPLILLTACLPSSCSLTAQNVSTLFCPTL